MKLTRRKCWIIGLALLLIGGYIALLVHWHLKRETALHGATPAVRVAALRSGEGVQVLIDALHDEDADVRMVAAQQLWRESRAARALMETLKDNQSGVRVEAAKSLAWIGSPAVPVLLEAFADPDPRARQGACLALDIMTHSKKSPDFSPEDISRIFTAIQPLLNDEDPEVRRHAESILKGLKSR
jgi:hypothetical protein